MKQYTYSVAIRTLGKAGEKYQRTLDSIKNQSFQATDIFVYIPDGYDLPKETIGIERYIRVTKGMIAQRALEYKEIEDEWILFLDDDIFLPPTFMEKAFMAVDKFDADVITANVFLNHTASLKQKIVMACTGVTPLLSSDWAFKVKTDGRYKYNNNPKSDFLKTQTGAGPVCLCRKEAFLKMHFEDEKWMDCFGYALGEDQLFHYKMYLMGYNLMIWYNSGAIHLDAGSADRSIDSKYLRKASACLYLLWHRSIYNLGNNTFGRKAIVSISYGLSLFINLMFSFAYVFTKKIYTAPYAILAGVADGIRFTRNKEYHDIPKFDAYIKK